MFLRVSWTWCFVLFFIIFSACSESDEAGAGAGKEKHQIQKVNQKAKTNDKRKLVVEKKNTQEAAQELETLFKRAEKLLSHIPNTRLHYERAGSFQGEETKFDAYTEFLTYQNCSARRLRIFLHGQALAEDQWSFYLSPEYYQLPYEIQYLKDLLESSQYHKLEFLRKDKEVEIAGKTHKLSCIGARFRLGDAELGEQRTLFFSKELPGTGLVERWIAQDLVQELKTFESDRETLPFPQKFQALLDFVEVYTSRLQAGFLPGAWSLFKSHGAGENQEFLVINTSIEGNIFKLEIYDEMGQKEEIEIDAQKLLMRKQNSSQEQETPWQPLIYTDRLFELKEEKAVNEEPFGKVWNLHLGALHDVFEPGRGQLQEVVLTPVYSMPEDDSMLLPGFGLRIRGHDQVLEWGEKLEQLPEALRRRFRLKNTSEK